MFLTMTSALLAAQAGPVPLAPVSKWVVEYEQGDCLLSRNFGDPARLTTFGLKPTPVGQQGAAVLVLPPGSMDRVSGRSGNGVIVLHPKATRIAVSWAATSIKSGRVAVKINIDTSGWAALPEAAAITFELGGIPPTTLTLQAVRAAFAAARKCNDDLLRRWGADPSAMLEPGSEGVRWFSPDDYPRFAIRAGEQGLVRIVATVDTRGVPSTCRVVVPSPSRALNDTTCDLVVRNARFPAAQPGEPLTRYLYLAVNWSLPT